LFFLFGAASMDIASFESKIKQLDQEQILTGAVRSLNKLLVDKGIVKEEELQDYFLHWLRESKPRKRTASRRKAR
jgi:hypothetical protein